VLHPIEITPYHTPARTARIARFLPLDVKKQKNPCALPTQRFLNSTARERAEAVHLRLGRKLSSAEAAPAVNGLYSVLKQA
jgi:hypothetical protein